MLEFQGIQMKMRATTKEKARIIQLDQHSAFLDYDV
jgi:hypothetical protein